MEARGKVTVARKPGIERQRREIVGVRQLYEGAHKAQLRQVSVQRYAFDLTKQVREVGRRGAYRAPHVGEVDGLRELRLEIGLGSHEEPPRRSGRGSQPRSICPGEKTRPKALQAQVQTTARRRNDAWARSPPLVASASSETMHSAGVKISSA